MQILIAGATDLNIENKSKMLVTKQVSLAGLLLGLCISCSAQNVLPRCNVTINQGDNVSLTVFANSCKADKCPSTTFYSDKSPESIAQVQALRRTHGFLRMVIPRQTGDLVCAGEVEDGVLNGNYTFNAHEGWTRSLPIRLTPVPNSTQLEEYAFLNVTKKWISALSTSGITDINTDNISQLKALDITSKYVDELRSAGITQLNAETLIELKAIKETGSEIADYTNVLGETPSARDLLTLYAMKVTPSDVKKFRPANGQPISVGEIIGKLSLKTVN
jgi:hypothetical protein